LNILSYIKKLFPGLFSVVLISFLAQILSPYTLIGAVATAIVLGIIIGNVFTIKDQFKEGISFSEKKLLNLAIVLMGANLNASIITLINYKTILILITIIITTILTAKIIGKLFNVSSNIALLLGVGNGICGSSAIAGTSFVINAEEKEVGISIAVINILGAVGIFLIPGIIMLFGIDSIYQQSVLIGGTIQAVGQVTAAGFIMGDEAGRLATLVKMVRILMLGPALIIFSILYSKQKNSQKKTSFIYVPPFILGFAALSIIASTGMISQNVIDFMSNSSKYLLLLAMSAIGMNISVRYILDKGMKVIFVSCITFSIQILICLFLVSKYL